MLDRRAAVVERRQRGHLGYGVLEAELELELDNRSDKSRIGGGARARRSHARGRVVLLTRLVCPENGVVVVVRVVRVGGVHQRALILHLERADNRERVARIHKAAETSSGERLLLLLLLLLLLRCIVVLARRTGGRHVQVVRARVDELADGVLDTRRHGRVQATRVERLELVELGLGAHQVAQRQPCLLLELLGPDDEQVADVLDHALDEMKLARNGGLARPYGRVHLGHEVVRLPAFGERELFVQQAHGRDVLDLGEDGALVRVLHAAYQLVQFVYTILDVFQKRVFRRERTNMNALTKKTIHSNS